MSALGTRTNSVVPLVWLKRVGFRHASKEWRVTFFSRAPRILTQGLGATAGVGANDITIPCSGPPPIGAPRDKERANATNHLVGEPAGCAVLLSCARSLHPNAKVGMLLNRSAKRQPDVQISLLNESDSSMIARRP